MLKTIGWGILLLSLFCSGAGLDKWAGAINPSMVCHLTSEQLKTMPEAALKGNAEAGFRLYKYYSMLTNDQNEARHWLYVAQKLGDKTALQNYQYFVTRDSESIRAVFAKPRNVPEWHEPEAGMRELYWAFVHYRLLQDNKYKKYANRLLQLKIDKVLLNIDDLKKYPAKKAD